MWGSKFVSPVLGRCDVTGTDPLCAVSFAIQATDGSVENVGSGMGVVYRDNRWQFYGDLLPIAINANAAVQRGVRVDDPTTPIQYSRALQFDIARTDGVACAVLKARDDAHSHDRDLQGLLARTRRACRCGRPTASSNTRQHRSGRRHAARQRRHLDAAAARHAPATT